VVRPFGGDYGSEGDPPTEGPPCRISPNAVPTAQQFEGDDVKTMKISPRELDLLRKVAAANDVGMPYYMDATTRTRQEHLSRRIGALIGHGLLVERAASVGAETFFSSRSRSYVLHITSLGRECCEALD